MIDTLTALEARDNLLYVADHWNHLRNRLHRSTSTQYGMKVSGGDAPAPINLHVSDLMHDITTQTVLWGKILMDESGWIPNRGEMPGLLHDVARQYGHFVTDDPKTGTDFCDLAHEYRRKTENILNQPEPAKYIGPCTAPGCQGELYMRDKTGGQCPTCGEPWTIEQQRMWLKAEMDNLLLTYTETYHALQIIGLGISWRTWERWTSNGTPDRPKTPKIAKDNDDLYSFKQAVELASRSAQHKHSPEAKRYALSR